MHGALTLLRHSLGRLRWLLAGLALVLALFQVLFVGLARTLYLSAGFTGLPPFLPPFFRQLAGEALPAFLSFAGVASFGYFHPAVVAALCALVIAVATEPAGEIETRFLDLALVRPVPRVALIARSAALVVLLPALVLLAMGAGTAAGLRWLAPAGAPLPETRLVASLAANLWALLACVGGLALAVGAASRRRAAAGSIAGIAALALFLVDYLARAWEPARTIARLSPFHYYRAVDLLLGRPLDWTHLAALAAGGAAGTVLALVIFLRRDL
ncbi:MAG TPA: hypothetical protein VI078_05285 [bacterium]